MRQVTLCADSLEPVVAHGKEGVRSRISHRWQPDPRRWGWFAGSAGPRDLARKKRSWRWWRRCRRWLSMVVEQVEKVNSQSTWTGWRLDKGTPRWRRPSARGCGVDGASWRPLGWLYSRDAVKWRTWTQVIKASQVPAGVVVRPSAMSFGSMSVDKATVSMRRVDVGGGGFRLTDVRCCRTRAW